MHTTLTCHVSWSTGWFISQSVFTLQLLLKYLESLFITAPAHLHETWQSTWQCYFLYCTRVGLQQHLETFVETLSSTSTVCELLLQSSPFMIFRHDTRFYSHYLVILLIHWSVGLSICSSIGRSVNDSISSALYFGQK